VIDFRYHVVSIIAVFLALTVGLVLGSSFVGQAVLNNLKSQVSNANSTNNKLRAEIQDLQTALSYKGSVLSKVTGPLVSGRLKGHDVALIVVPGASGTVVNETVTTLKQAGATVVTQLTLTSAYSDSTQQAQLASVASGNAPIGATIDPTMTTQQQAAFDLAAALTHKVSDAAATSTTPPATTTPAGTQQATGTATGTDTSILTAHEADAILTGFANAGFVTLSGNPPTAAADMAVVVAGTENESNTDQANTDHIGLMNALTALDATTVVGGTSVSATSPGLIAAVIGDGGGAGKRVSTVDTADDASGQIGIVFSLVDQYTSAKVGHYGMTGTTDGPLPSIPSSTPTGTATP
jgi:hypothetical protein